jgi:hypothetical protein
VANWYLDLLEGVNENMTGIELKYVTMAHLELTGNCYWLLDGVTDAMSPPRAIYPLNPGRVRVKLDKTSFPYKLSHYEFTIDGKVFRTRITTRWNTTAPNRYECRGEHRPHPQRLECGTRRRMRRCALLQRTRRQSCWH